MAAKKTASSEEGQKERALAICTDIMARAKARGSLPDLKSKDPVQREDAKWIEEVKKDKKRQEADAALKRELLARAKAGKPRPAANRRLGRALTRFTTKPS